MGRKKKGERVLGPYEERGQFRVKVVIAGKPSSRTFATRATAERFARAARKELNTTIHDTETARDEYEEYLRKHKGNKPNSIERTMWSLRSFFPKPIPLDLLSVRRCQSLYTALAERLAVDSHRNALKETRTFLEWCIGQGWIRSNPLDGVKGIGARRKGRNKPQLTRREARLWMAKAIELVESGNESPRKRKYGGTTADGALASLMALLLGLREHEILQAQVRDLDDETERADLFIVRQSKTENGVRTLRIPEVLRPYLIELAGDRDGDALLFTSPRTGERYTRGWVRNQVRRICALAKVPEVPVHGLRRTHATLSVDHGATGQVVADSFLKPAPYPSGRLDLNQRPLDPQARNKRVIALGCEAITFRNPARLPFSGS